MPADFVQFLHTLLSSCHVILDYVVWSLREHFGCITRFRVRNKMGNFNLFWMSNIWFKMILQSNATIETKPKTKKKQLIVTHRMNLHAIKNAKIRNCITRDADHRKQIKASRLGCILQSAGSSSIVSLTHFVTVAECYCNSYLISVFVCA